MKKFREFNVFFDDYYLAGWCVWRMNKTNKQHNPFYDSSIWRKKRDMIKRRDKQMCQFCLRRGKIVLATTVHHIKPLEEYPELGLIDNNLVSLSKHSTPWRRL